ncbi:MAG: CRTAC1 family protein [Bryobacteraceae bacterium]|nr:CRTAC1 family protein [Bryobacteraceae bacterium]
MKLLAQMASRGVRPMPRGKASGLPFNAHFTDVAHQSGVVKPVVYGPPGRMDYILEAMGCGIAFLDYDNDGWLDIFVLSGTRKEGAVPGASNRLYKNNRDGTFTDVTERAGLLRQGWAYGVTVADYNNDGFEDIFISCFGKNVLYRNNGNGTFTDVTQAAGLLDAGDRFTTGCSWVDYDRDGWLDLFVSHYVVFDFKTIPPTGKDPACNFKGIPVNCGPRGLQPERSSLYHNNGDGTFTEVTSRTGISKANPSYGLTVVAADFDGDGWQDVYVASDSKASQFFHNKHDGTFAEEGLERGVALNDDGAEQAGMGLGIGDFGLDGTLGVLKTHFTEDTPALYRNDGKGNFQDMTLRAGLGVETRYVSWGAGIQDFDNDGWPDIFWVTGSVYPEVEKTHPEYAFRTPRVLFRNLGRGQFEELTDLAGPAIGELHASRGVAFGDFDNDGDVDILIMNIDEPPSLLRNDVTGNNHWLKVFLKGTKSNRSAIGATVIASYGGKRQAQAVMAQSGYLSVNDRRLHFGLGESQTADLTIAWPSGARESYSHLAADRLYTIKEGSGVEKSEEFKRVALP